MWPERFLRQVSNLEKPNKLFSYHIMKYIPSFQNLLMLTKGSIGTGTGEGAQFKSFLKMTSQSPNIVELKKRIKSPDHSFASIPPAKFCNTKIGELEHSNALEFVKTNQST